MKTKLFFLATLLTCSIGAMAQWVKPDLPSGTTLKTAEEVYLYNVEADAFFLGANEYLTRASVDGTRGYKVWLDKYAEDDISYYITNYIEDGWNAGNTLCVYMANDNGPENVWIDNAKDTETDKLFTFEKLGDDTFRIGLSHVNKYNNPTNYADTYLGLIPEKNDTRLYLCDPQTFPVPDYDTEKFQTTWKILLPAEYTAYVTAKKTWLAAVSLGEEIEKAKTENVGIDISEIEVVYNNFSSTEEELKAASAKLVKMVIVIPIMPKILPL